MEGLSAVGHICETGTQNRYTRESTLSLNALPVVLYAKHASKMPSGQPEEVECVAHSTNPKPTLLLTLIFLST